MINLTISAIAGFFVFACLNNPQEIGYLGAIGWVFVSIYFFICSMINQYIQKEKNDPNS